MCAISTTCWGASWSAASAPACRVSLAFIDLDQFKLVNDAHGHLIGSELLARTGQRLQELSRKQDYCFRYGGDEFVILMPETRRRGRDGTRRPACFARCMDTRFRMKNGLRAERQRQRRPVHRIPRTGPPSTRLSAPPTTRMYAVKTSGRGHVRGV